MVHSQSIPPKVASEHPKRWHRVVGACLMNLAFGNVYGWSVFVAPLEREFGWKRAETSMVFTLAIFMTAFMSWFSGWIYDRRGPSISAFGGALLGSAGFFFSAYAHTLGQLYLLFGIVGGLGAGLGCTVIIAVLSKWFPDRRGLAVGISVGAFSASSAIFGPLAGAVLIPRYGIGNTFKIMGLIFFLMTMAGALLLKDPPRSEPAATRSLGANPSQPQFTPKEMFQHPTFYFMWIGYALGSASGLMVISQIVPYLSSRGIDSRSVASIVLILGAAASIVGRVLAGWLSDAWGRLPMLRLIVALSAAAMPMLYGAGHAIVVVYGTVALVYFCYGAQFCINAATCADFWGTKHVGMNYGIVLTAWGVGGVIGPRIAGVLFDRNHDYRIAFLSASALGVAALICEFLARRPVPSNHGSAEVLIANAS